MKKTVVAAMSGGVDSSVAAALLLEQGYNVIGATLVFKPCDDADNVSWCCGMGAVENARAVCQTLGIRHYVVDCAKEFEEAVLRPAWEAYCSGRTPSPCIACNGKIKFRILLDYAKKLGASYIATGHYSIVNHGECPTLQRGTYLRKDQTYFLFSLDKEQLNHTLFPLGEMTKQQVRDIAQQKNFINAKRPESQDACFVTSEGSFAEALRHRFGAESKPGQIVSPEGNVLGTHKGIYNYTIGQRKGLGIALGHKAYVTRIDAQTSQVELSTKEESLYAKGLLADNISWTGDVVPAFPLLCLAQIRYKSRTTTAEVTLENDCIKVLFDTPQKAVAPGQAVVLYDGDRVLGGGWIKKAL